EALGALDERRELQVAVAVHAGDGRPSRGVLADEVRDHVLLELVLEVDDVVGNADRPRGAPGVVEIVQGAAAAELHLALRLVIELHGQTDHIVTLARQQGCCHRRIHAPTHGYDDAHVNSQSPTSNSQLIPNAQLPRIPTPKTQFPNPSPNSRGVLGVGRWEFIGSWALAIGS